MNVVKIWSNRGVVTAARGNPTRLELFGFAMAAVAAFFLLDLLVVSGRPAWSVAPFLAGLAYVLVRPVGLAIGRTDGRTPEPARATPMNHPESLHLKTSRRGEAVSATSARTNT